MSSPSRRFSKALRELALAALNATLILVALCLFFGWRIAQEVHGVTSEITTQIARVEPLQAEIHTMTSELSALRADLAALREDPRLLPDEAPAALTAELAALNARLEEVHGGVEALRHRAVEALDDPGALVEQAVRAATAQVSESVTGLVGCASSAPRGARLPDTPTP